MLLLVKALSNSEYFGIFGFKVWSMTRKNFRDDKDFAHFLTFVREDACGLIKSLRFPEKNIAIPKELIPNNVKCFYFECCEGTEFHKLVRQNNQKVAECILGL